MLAAAEHARQEELQRLRDECALALAEAVAAAERERAQHTAEQQRWEEKDAARAETVLPLPLCLHLLCLPLRSSRRRPSTPHCRRRLVALPLPLHRANSSPLHHASRPP